MRTALHCVVTPVPPNSSDAAATTISLGERTKRKGSTVNRYLQLLSKIFELAFEEGYVDSNPVRRVPLESEGEGRERYLTYEEEARLLPVLTGRLAHLRCPVIVAVDTGMRSIASC